MHLVGNWAQQPLNGTAPSSGTVHPGLTAELLLSTAVGLSARNRCCEREALGNFSRAWNHRSASSQCRCWITDSLIKEGTLFRKFIDFSFFAFLLLCVSAGPHIHSTLRVFSFKPWAVFSTWISLILEGKNTRKPNTYIPKTLKPDTWRPLYNPKTIDPKTLNPKWLRIASIFRNFFEQFSIDRN